MDRRNNDRIKPVQQQRFTLRIVDRVFDVKPENISFGGMSLISGVLFPVNTLLEIDLSYGDITATCMAKVRHRHASGFGLEFLNASDRFCELINMANELIDLTADPKKQDDGDKDQGDCKTAITV